MKLDRASIGPSNEATCTGTNSQPEFDHHVNCFSSNVADMRGIIDRIVDILYIPRPCEPNEKKSERPGTVSQALGMTNDFLVEQNDRLRQIANTLSKHFGELKLD